MLKIIRYILFLFLLHFAFPALAQEEVEVMVDTLVTITEAPAVEELNTAPFDLVGQQQPVEVRSVPKKLVDSLKNSDDFWYANRAPQKKKLEEQKEQPGGTSFLQQGWFRDLLWVIILSSFIGIVIWYLVSSNILIFRKKAKSITSEEDTEAATDDIFALNYDREIQKAEEAKNHRLAVRLWYLRTLKDLAEKGRIDYRYGRTNHDYVAQLYKSSYYRDFFRLTRNFEYTWYGQFHLSAEAYDMMRHDFKEFKNGLG